MSNKFVVEGGLSIPSGKELEIAGSSLTSILTGDTLSDDVANKKVIPSEYSVAKYVSSQLSSSDLDIKVGETNYDIDLDSEKLIFAGTANEIEVAYAEDTSEGTHTLTVSLPDAVSGLTSISATTVTGTTVGDGTASLNAGSWADLVNVTMTGNLTSSGNTSIGGTLAVTGIATFTEQSVHTGGIDCNGTLDLGANSITGTADEMIISADGTETSASGSADDSLTLNASGGIFTDDAVDMDSTLNVQGVVTLQSDLAMANSTKRDFTVDMTGSAVEVANLTGFESGKIVLKVKDSSNNITTKEILAVNGAFVEYATISSGTEVDITIAVSGDSVTVNSANGTAKGSVDLIK